MQPSVHEYLQHILDEARFLTLAVLDTSQQKFLQDETLKRAFVRSIEIIGEAVKQIPEVYVNSIHISIGVRLLECATA